jgi:hypothetical protein
MSRTNVTVKTNLVISSGQYQHWKELLEMYDLSFDDIGSVVTNDFTDNNNVPYLIADYCNAQGETLFNSQPYYTVKDCIRDNAIFANAGILVLDHSNLFNGHRKLQAIV